MEFQSRNRLMQLIICPSLLPRGSWAGQRWLTVNLSANIFEQIRNKCEIRPNREFYVTCPKGFAVFESLTLTQLVLRSVGPFNVLPTSEGVSDDSIEEEDTSMDMSEKVSKEEREQVTETTTVRSFETLVCVNDKTPEKATDITNDDEGILEAERPAFVSVCDEDSPKTSTPKDFGATFSQEYPTLVDSDNAEEKATVGEKWTAVTEIHSIYAGSVIKFQYEGETFLMDVSDVKDRSVIGRVSSGPQACKEKKMQIVYARVENMQMLCEQERGTESEQSDLTPTNKEYLPATPKSAPGRLW